MEPCTIHTYNVLGKELKIKTVMVKTSYGEDTRETEHVVDVYVDGVSKLISSNIEIVAELKYSLTWNDHLSYEETCLLSELTEEFEVADYKSVSYECECCGSYTSEFWNLVCHKGSFEVFDDGHFCYGFMPSPSHIEELHATGKVTREVD